MLQKQYQMPPLENYPKISVFIPVYNQEKFIAETLDSVFIQDYPEIEVVIGDDCSTDGTIGILEKYKQKFPGTIQLIQSEKHEGITAVCNKILKQCTGDFLAFLGGDDYWLPGKLKKQVEWFRNNSDAVLCFTLTRAFDNETKNILYTQPSVTFEELYSMDVFSKTYNLGSSGSSFLILRSAIPADGFNPLLKMVSDWLFYIELVNNKKIGGIDEVLTMYRRHGKNFSNNLESIFNEHYLTLQLVRNKYPELEEDIKKWEEETLRKMFLIKGQSLESAFENSNLKTTWEKASDFMSFKGYFKQMVGYTRRRFFKLFY